MVIIDAGPLVALFDRTEPANEQCHSAVKQLKSPPLTTWPVLTEAFHLLHDWERGQSKLWGFIMAGGLRIEDISSDQHNRMRAFMEKYRDAPMDLADASLVVLAEDLKIKTVFTLDRRDFSRYRPRHCKLFTIIP